MPASELLGIEVVNERGDLAAEIADLVEDADTICAVLGGAAIESHGLSLLTRDRPSRMVGTSSAAPGGLSAGCGHESLWRPDALWSWSIRRAGKVRRTSAPG